MYRTRLKQRIMESGLKQTHLSKMIGIAPNTFSLYVHGKRIPDVITAQKIARALNTTVDYLWPLEDGSDGG
ncbi:MAG: helix-turn-helix transcriptional regulator [Alicyclobacillus macrosporangiidus]|uniref:helix-turn-helix domain-containing protein n=1 Tax=Alicyclobacillus macrosporangiidus TaxID=392015 RepID=UPI0034E95AA7|nr:helix-turn-helix transcriptional regulator [Alicyclobacillus macrosporangiidus]